MCFFCVLLQLLQNVCFPTQNFQALPRQPLQITKKQYVQGELHTNQPPCTSCSRTVFNVKIYVSEDEEDHSHEPMNL